MARAKGTTTKQIHGLLACVAGNPLKQVAAYIVPSDTMIPHCMDIAEIYLSSRNIRIRGKLGSRIQFAENKVLTVLPVGTSPNALLGSACLISIDHSTLLMDENDANLKWWRELQQRMDAR